MKPPTDQERGVALGALWTQVMQFIGIFVSVWLIFETLHSYYPHIPVMPLRLVAQLAVGLDILVLSLTAWTEDK